MTRLQRVAGDGGGARRATSRRAWRGAWLPILMVLCAANCAPARKAAPAAIPVSTATVASGDVPIELSGLGRVQAFNTAVARAQIAGQIVSIEFVEGQSVKPGDRIAQIDPRPLEAALAQDKANAERDKANLANAVADLDRYVPLSTQGLVSTQQVETQRSQVAQLRATVASDEAVIERDRLQLIYASIRAPITGVTGLRLIDVGNLVSPSDPQGVVTIQQIQPIAVLFTLPQSDLPDVRDSMDAAGPSGLQVDAYAQGGGATTPLDVGRLRLINNQVDLTSGTVILKAIFPNPQKRLWPGQSVDARLILTHRSNGLTVPSSVVQQGPGRPYAWVVKTDGTVVATPVTVGPTIGDRTLIVSGLAAGERVVTDGQFNLKAGARVAPVAAAPGQPAPPLKSTSQEALGVTP